MFQLYDDTATMAEESPGKIFDRAAPPDLYNTILRSLETRMGDLPELLSNPAFAHAAGSEVGYLYSLSFRPDLIPLEYKPVLATFAF